MKKIKEIIKDNLFTIAILTFIIISIILRLIALNNPFSHDEWYTLDIIARNFSSMNLQMYDDVHVPLYFYIAKLYVSLVGLTKYNLKILSFIFGILGIIFFFIFTNKYFNKRITMISLLIVSISVFHIAYSQVARMYSLVFLLSVSCLYFLFGIIFSKEKNAIIGYTISNILLLYTHFFGIFFLLFETIVLYKFRKDINNIKKLIKSQIILLVTLIPFFLFMLVQIIRKINGTSYSAWMAQTKPFDLYLSFSALSSNHILTPVFIIILIYFIWKHIKLKEIFNEQNKKENILFWSVLICLILPSIITLLTPILAWRYFFIFYPSFVIIIAIALDNFYCKEKSLTKILIFLILFFLILSSIVYLTKLNNVTKSEKECINLIEEKIENYEKNNTFFITYRWLNEWVPNHRPITGAQKELEKDFKQKMLLINYYSTDIDYLFENYTNIMAISPSGSNKEFVQTKNAIITEQGDCNELSSEKIFFYSYHYYIYSENKTKN